MRKYDKNILIRGQRYSNRLECPFFLIKNHAMTAYVLGSGGNLHAFLSWKIYGDGFMPLPLYPRKVSPLYPINRRMCRLRNWSGDFRENKNPLSLLGMEPFFSSRQSCR